MHNFNHKQNVIRVALAEHKNIIHSDSVDELKRHLNMLENVFIMCACNVRGIAEIKIAITDTKNKINGYATIY